MSSLSARFCAQSRWARKGAETSEKYYGRLLREKFLVRIGRERGCLPKYGGDHGSQLGGVARFGKVPRPALGSRFTCSILRVVCRHHNHRKLRVIGSNGPQDGKAVPVG